MVHKTDLEWNASNEFRKIIHIDMDAFFAAVEQRDNPQLQGKPIAIGFNGPRGVVSTASYEARKFGVHSAMSIAKAKQLCPQLLIVPHRRNVYQDVSRDIHSIFHEYTDIIEPLSIDEAFLDVSKYSSKEKTAQEIAQEIKEKIKQQLHLTASAGVSYNKFLAKIASDFNKPDGLMIIPPEEAFDFIGKLPIEKFWGIGPKTAQQMHHIGVFNGAQLRELSLNHLKEIFGKNGKIYYEFSRGIDNRPVITSFTRKSIGCEETFTEDIHLQSTILVQLYHLVLELVHRIEISKFSGHTLTLKVKYNDFTQITKSKTQPKALKRKEAILPLAKSLLKETNLQEHPIRLLGLSISNEYSQETNLNNELLEEGWLNFE